MSEIAYSTAITAEDVNNLAVDLGATEFSQFQNSEPYAVQQLNNITKDLVSAGILLSLNQCKLTKAEDKVTIDTGIIVFNNGAKKRITEALQVDFVANTYIYALNNTATNTCQIVVSETEPDSTSDYVMLGQVDADGNVLDKRFFSKYKAAPNAAITPIHHDTYEIAFSSKPTETILRKTIDVGDASYAFVAVNGTNSIGRIVPLDETGKSGSFCVNKVYGQSGYSYSQHIYFKKNGSILEIYGSSENFIRDHKATIELYLF
ncbi:MAG: hypothetical protein E7397_04600 [Ruminococcaceae bacterium]|nr:hypothetical protein [Oscillospiraceae bacterium]